MDIEIESLLVELCSITSVTYSSNYLRQSLEDVIEEVKRIQDRLEYAYEELAGEYY